MIDDTITKLVILSQSTSGYQLNDSQNAQMSQTYLRSPTMLGDLQIILVGSDYSAAVLMSGVCLVHYYYYNTWIILLGDKSSTAADVSCDSGMASVSVAHDITDMVQPGVCFGKGLESMVSSRISLSIAMSHSDLSGTLLSHKSLL